MYRKEHGAGCLALCIVQLFVPGPVSYGSFWQCVLLLWQFEPKRARDLEFLDNAPRKSKNKFQLYLFSLSTRLYQNYKYI